MANSSRDITIFPELLSHLIKFEITITAIVLHQMKIDYRILCLVGRNDNEDFRGDFL